MPPKGAETRSSDTLKAPKLYGANITPKPVTCPDSWWLESDEPFAVKLKRANQRMSQSGVNFYGKAKEAGE